MVLEWLWMKRVLHTNDPWQRLPEQVQDPEPRRPQRRTSYFELHSERRQMHMHVGGDREAC